jgi:hypothetical protein
MRFGGTATQDGAAGLTVKPLKGNDVPLIVVAVTACVPVDAPGSIEIVMGKLVAVPPVPIVAVTPVPLKVTAVAPDRLMPEIVAGTVAPCVPEDGEIPEIDGAGFTVKPVNGADVPIAVVTVTVCVPLGAPDEIETVMGRFVAVPPVPMVAVTPEPLKLTAVAPDRLVPVMLADSVAPWPPDEGEIPEIVGPGFTVNPVNDAEVPAGVVTITVRVPVAAPDEIDMLIGTFVAVPPVPMVAVTPEPLNVTALAPDKFKPVTLADTLEPCPPDEGEIPEIAGVGSTVKPVNGAEVPAGVVTVIVRVFVAAPDWIETVIGRVVAVPPVPIVAVTPVPLNVTAVAPDRFKPVIVPDVTVSGRAELGVIPEMTGV